MECSEAIADCIGIVLQGWNIWWDCRGACGIILGFLLICIVFGCYRFRKSEAAIILMGFAVAPLLVVWVFFCNAAP